MFLTQKHTTLSSLVELLLQDICIQTCLPISFGWLSQVSFFIYLLYLAEDNWLFTVDEGGIITWSMRSDYGLTSPRFTHFDSDVDKLVSDGVWRHHVPCKDIDQYLLGSDGYVYTMQKI